MLRILVTPSVLMAQAAELVLVTLEAFSDSNVFNVTFKFHPTLPAARVMSEAGVSSLPAHMTIAREAVPALLKDADVMLYTYSATAIEALAAGVPIVHFATNCDIDLDPLASFSGIRISTGTPEGLREEAVKAVLGVSPAEHAARVRRWREVVELLLPPPDSRTIDLFMPDSFREARSSAGHVATNVR